MRAAASLNGSMRGPWALHHDAGVTPAKADMVVVNALLRPRSRRCSGARDLTLHGHRQTPVEWGLLCKAGRRCGCDGFSRQGQVQRWCGGACCGRVGRVGRLCRQENAIGSARRCSVHGGAGCWRTAVALAAQACWLLCGLWLRGAGRFCPTRFKRRKRRQPHRDGRGACAAADPMNGVFGRPPDQQTGDVQADHQQAHTGLARSAPRAHAAGVRYARRQAGIPKTLLPIAIFPLNLTAYPGELLQTQGPPNGCVRSPEL
jgi:hypothetical protein